MSSSNTSWIEKILSKVTISDIQTVERNKLYNEEEKPIFINMFSIIVLWSDVANRIFKSKEDKSNSSSDVESNFKTIKHSIFGRKITRLDAFVQAHVTYVNGEIKLLAGSKPLNEPRQRSPSEEDTEEKDIDLEKIGEKKTELRVRSFSEEYLVDPVIGNIYIVQLNNKVLFYSIGLI